MTATTMSTQGYQTQRLLVATVPHFDALVVCDSKICPVAADLAAPFDIRERPYHYHYQTHARPLLEVLAEHMAKVRAKRAS